MKMLHNQRGDTIVEVLIAVAITGLLLTGSYAVSNKNSLSIRLAQERSEAQKIAASRIETLRAYHATISGGLDLDSVLDGATFCIVDTGSLTRTSSCTQTIGGVDYQTVIKKRIVSSESGYAIITTWPSVSSGEQNVEYQYVP